MEDALEQLTAAEAISGYKPADGAAPVAASKALRLQRLPPLLVLYLMRFDPANRHQKIRCGAARRWLVWRVVANGLGLGLGWVGGFGETGSRRHRAWVGGMY